MSKYLVGGLVTGLYLLWSASASATVLVFGGPGQTNNVAIPQTFGDRVTEDGDGISIANGTTPNIDLTWSATGGDDGIPGWEFYNDPDWIAAQLNSESSKTAYFLTFTPDSGYGVIVDSFVYDNYAGHQGGAIFNWALLRDGPNGTAIAFANDVPATDAGSDDKGPGNNVLVNTGMVTPYFGTVVLRITHSPDPDVQGTSDAALDNISFTQHVPEPASWILVSMGTIGAGIFASRRRK